MQGSQTYSLDLAYVATSSGLLVTGGLGNLGAWLRELRPAVEDDAPKPHWTWLLVAGRQARAVPTALLPPLLELPLPLTSPPPLAPQFRFGPGHKTRWVPGSKGMSRCNKISRRSTTDQNFISGRKREKLHLWMKYGK